MSKQEMQIADQILLASAVITCNDAWVIFQPGAVAILDHQIVAVGHPADILGAFQSNMTFDFGAKVIMPGLVNTHTHAPMTLLRGLADDLRLDVWLMGYVMPVERQFVTPEMCYLGTRLACAEMIRSGVTCFADMYYFEDQVAQATADSGLRAVCCETILKFPAPDATSYEHSLAYTRDFIQKWQHHPLITPGIAPHAPYTCTAEILQACSALAQEWDAPLQIHLSETEREVQEMQQLHKLRGAAWLHQNNVFKAKTLAAHCVYLDDSEMRLLYEHQAGVLHNPTSNLKLASGVAPVAQMLAHGLAVGIATDGPASNNDLDMFEEMRLTALLAKGISKDPTELPARTVFGMATIGGARAIHQSHLTGSLEVGKRADLVVIDIQTIHNTPQFQRDPDALYAQLVYAAKAHDVSDVMVDGRWLMRDRQLLTVNEGELLEQAQMFAVQVDKFLREREQSVLRKLVAIAGLEHQESFEIQVKLAIPNRRAIVQHLLSLPDLTLLRHRHYRQFDNYFYFAAPETDMLRVREDEQLDEHGRVINARYRLTLIGPAHEQSMTGSMLVSRSRFIAPSQHSLRFYQEYFHPQRMHRVSKDRQRWHVLFRGVELCVNVDEVHEPKLGYFLEIKSRTWSERDASDKATIIRDLVSLLGLQHLSPVGKHYADLREKA